MRFPALRMPAFRLSFDWLSSIGGRRTFLYGFYTTILFLIFFVANFPHNALVQRVLQSVDLQGQGMRLEVGDTRFAWWQGYELQRVKLAPVDPDRPPFVEASSIFVRPRLDGLMHGQINSVHAKAVMYGGAVAGEFSVSDGMRRATVAIEDVQLQRSPLISSFLQEGTIAGLLSGAITLEDHGGDARAAGELDLDHASVTDAKYIIPLPALHFDKAETKFSFQSNRLDVQEFEANGPELRLSISGQIALREPIGDSVLNLKLTALPGPNAPDEVKNFLQLLPPLPKNAKPDTPRVISGTLKFPRVR